MNEATPRAWGGLCGGGLGACGAWANHLTAPG